MEMQMPRKNDLMISGGLYDDLRPELLAYAAITDLFLVHGRRPFLPRPDDLGMACWEGRSGQRAFARAITVLHAKGHLKQLSGGRYKVVSGYILTVAEFRKRYPNVKWGNGMATPL
jgi:hypothetical protein